MDTRGSTGRSLPVTYPGNTPSNCIDQGPHIQTVSWALQTLFNEKNPFDTRSHAKKVTHSTQCNSKPKPPIEFTACRSFRPVGPSQGMPDRPRRVQNRDLVGSSSGDQQPRNWPIPRSLSETHDLQIWWHCDCWLQFVHCFGGPQIHAGFYRPTTNSGRQLLADDDKLLLCSRWRNTILMHTCSCQG